MSVPPNPVPDGSVLDNVIWQSLTGPHGRFAQRVGGAVRFDPSVSVFSAIDDQSSADPWADLGQLVGPGGHAFLWRPQMDVPRGWTVDWSVTCVQMVATGALGAPADGAVELTVADVPEMMALVDAARPGPFTTRTIELGRYVGLRRDGQLVAMAGERLRVDGYCEISAVCTDDRWRRQGLADALVGDVMAGIEARGQVAILHVAESNASAIKLYERLGFEPRVTFNVMETRPV